MGLITKSDLRGVSIDAELRKSAPFPRDAGGVLSEQAKASMTTKFDVFLSHSYRDAKSLGADELLRLKKLLEGHGLSVYVDWIVDRQLSRDRVNAESAARIRSRMEQSRCLLFATSTTSSESKWMPWELGYKDGASKMAAILPVVDQRTNSFHGQEYLGLYPYVTRSQNDVGRTVLWIETNDGKYVSFNDWLRNGRSPYRHRPAS